jgi:hypothetical protein
LLTQVCVSIAVSLWIKKMKFSTCLAIVLALVCCQAAQASSRRRLPEDAKGVNSTSRAFAVWPYYGNRISNQQQKNTFLFHFF